MKFSLDLRKSPAENANFYYQKAKKAKRKIKGAKRALEETLKKIEKLKAKKEVEGEKEEQEKRKLQQKKLREKKRKWYEKFRYFFSSDNFLVIGGKDATSNEVIIKKHLEKEDLVFHANISGAPFFIIKNPDKKKAISELTLKETAQAAASYSKAWKLGLGSCDVYYIKPEQVSKRTPSGEYIGKGAFMISGKKNWLRNTELKIGIGVKFNKEGEMEVIGGPVSAINLKCRYYVIIKPGHKKSKELAKEIKNKILKKTNKSDGMMIKKEVSLEEIQKWIPGGEGMVTVN
jgi:predicted ribosome quality control (RQC) complex YloA/Tae2 family protein